jgi:hypothetical protein
MSKHKIGDKIRHSVHGEGTVTAVGTVLETPKPIDRVKLDGERWNLKARIAEIERLLERGDEPRPVDVYTWTFDSGRKVENASELGTAKLKERFLTPPEPESEPEPPAE